MEQIDGTMEAQNLYQICRKSSSYETGICFHSRNPQIPPEHITYRELRDRAKQDASKIRKLYGITSQTIFLLHFDRHKHSIRWFWAVIAAGCIPVILPPLTKDIGQLKQHLRHISNLLREPIVLTTRDLEQDFQSQKQYRVYTVESYQLSGGSNSNSKTFEATHSPPGDLKRPDELACLALTSGSSGNCKAVCLRHGQILSALRCKIACHQTNQEDCFLNYIGLDHVANLTEIHLHAMYLGADQTHIGGSGIIREPLLFLSLIHEYRISYTFATKSLLVSLAPCLKNDIPYEFDLSCLKALITGGDATPISTCTSVIEKLRSYGVVGNFLQPGFGMTETCAGCTYNKACPEYEQNHNLEYTSQGKPTQAVSMRIVSAHDNEPLKNGEKGSLQLCGSAVFSEYFNDPEATKESFTPDGWFKTGDDAIIYPHGYLVITGRAKETITINDKAFTPLDFETAVEKAEIPGITPSYTVAFAYRHGVTGAQYICMLYVPEPGYTDAQARAQITDAIAKECFELAGDVPFDILAVDKASLRKSSLGKISRVKTQMAWERGAFFKFRGSASV